MGLLGSRRKVVVHTKQRELSPGRLGGQAAAEVCSARTTRRAWCLIAETAEALLHVAEAPDVPSGASGISRTMAPQAPRRLTRRRCGSRAIRPTGSASLGLWSSDLRRLRNRASLTPPVAHVDSGMRTRG